MMGSLGQKVGSFLGTAKKAAPKAESDQSAEAATSQASGPATSRTTTAAALDQPATSTRCAIDRGWDHLRSDLGPADLHGTRANILR